MYGMGSHSGNMKFRNCPHQKPGRLVGLPGRASAGVFQLGEEEFLRQRAPILVRDLVADILDRYAAILC